MSRKLQILFKVGLLTYLLLISPFFLKVNEYLFETTSYLSCAPFEYNAIIKEVSIKDRLNLLNVNDDVLYTDEQDTILVDTNFFESNDEVIQDSTDVKKVYIYNTHQSEEYADENTVIEASIYLANLLQEANIQVVYETNEIATYLNDHGLDYNDSYEASNYYLNEALVNYGGFDLVIDLHRDSIPRESTYVEIDGVAYAKMMFVVGNLSQHSEYITNLSNELKGLVDAQVSGVMKDAFSRESYYNQHVYQNMVLIEVGSNTNTYEEVLHSTELLAQAIIQYLG